MATAATAANQRLRRARETAMPRAFDASTGILRFTVQLEHMQITAYLSEATWCARFGPATSDSSMLELYLQSQPMIDAAVAHRARAGARNPVVLRASDL